MSSDPVVDLAFSLLGTGSAHLPRDHGHALYGALCRELPALHGAEWLGVHPIGGLPLDRDTLRLDRGSQLRLRLPAARIADVLRLAGKRLEVAGSAIRIGAPTVYALAPANELDARLVLVKLTRSGAPYADVFADRYRIELARQLSALGIDRPLELCGLRRITVGGRRLAGYAVRVRDLEPAESLRLQEAGLGGKRRMGCGIFRPTRGGTCRSIASKNRDAAE